MCSGVTYIRKNIEVYKDKISYKNRHLLRELDSEKSKEKISIDGNVGTLIIFDTDVWHQAESFQKEQEEL